MKNAIISRQVYRRLLFDDQFYRFPGNNGTPSDSRKSRRSLARAYSIGKWKMFRKAGESK